MPSRTLIVSRNVTLRDRRGNRLQDARYSRPFVWSGMNTLVAFKNAVIALNNQVRRNKVGAIIYRVRVPAGQKMSVKRVLRSPRLFQAKYGNDGQPFTSFYRPAGELMRVRAKLPARLEMWENRN